MQAEWNNRKAETGPQTALGPKQRAYKSVLEEAADLARELKEPGLEEETRASIETRLDHLKLSARALELEIKAEAAKRRNEIRETAVESRKALLAEMQDVIEQAARESKWEMVVMRYRGGDLPDTLLGNARNVVWVTDEVIKRWNAVTEEDDRPDQ